MNTLLNKINKDMIHGLSVACPGPLDSKNGIILNTPNLKLFRKCVYHPRRQTKSLPYFLSMYFKVPNINEKMSNTTYRTTYCIVKITLMFAVALKPRLTIYVQFNGKVTYPLFLTKF